MTLLDAKRNKIAELLTFIAARLEELEGEKDELKEFHNADRERRCLEYALYTRELEEVANGLEQVSNSIPIKLSNYSTEV